MQKLSNDFLAVQEHDIECFHKHVGREPGGSESNGKLYLLIHLSQVTV